MNSNDKSEKITSDNRVKSGEVIVNDAEITFLETGFSGNNINFRFKTPKISYDIDYHLVYPEQQIGGGGIYLTLLSALTHSLTVSLNLVGIGYISGIMIETPDMDVPPDPNPPWSEDDR
ncbi:hypothetical protein [Xenorhabdus sp. IM139775]|uniref:hypothetical protein n=1 Tax=Xenorhabdus sp. IM139775 TaxID=3025876 RepID=UPI0023593741|nr:hypothetical protein [Xenorhabdus sp. IM139775]MDC9594627.1 hypothetical protein [Xenorhabdus sp. IM139775]